ncbi:nicotinate (nicotinamide) nucleotide adenylyltransferase [Ramlibacter albus]|uniref:Probable nicotinate-nucleotide adenylyltransferase n=1 Tax=Ramlibacter albus TaxID=2079448 RepID=A0A923M636_9BURK|nr:nicotinate (nicotinamide) nucleotide adenylyltransferase [Ramlibacter albus]
MTRLGLFGGAFDPPHIAHVALARAAVEQLSLDELRICPTGGAYHRASAPTDAQHRLAMAREAFAEVPRAVVDDREIRRGGATYTVDTLRELHAEQPSAVLHLVMGEDQAAGFTKWREWEAIARLATICVASRQYSAAAQPPLALPAGVRSVQLRLPDHPESATEVRHRLTLGQDIGDLVPPGVARYIAHHHLYQPL